MDRKQTERDVQNSVWNDLDDDQMRRLLQMAHPRPRLSKDQLDRAKSNLKVRWNSKVQSRKEKRWTILLAATGCAALIASFVFALRYFQSSAVVVPAEPAAMIERVLGPFRSSEGLLLQPGHSLPERSEVFTGKDGFAALRLRTHASLRLSSSTRIRLLTQTRVQLLEGTVYVDSGKSKPGPGANIEIYTDLGVIREKGTQFEVRCDAHELRVRVREGQVEMARAQDREIASMGVELIASPGRAIARRSIPVFGPEWDWVQNVSPVFHLEGSSLDEFLTWVARENGWQIWYADESLAKTAPHIVLHGSVGNLTAKAISTPVLSSCGLQFRFEDGLMVIERKPNSSTKR
jgi:ferric-dicitrate binding protein FerR (iron transport regulator)